MSKLYVNPFGVHLLCLWPDEVYTSLNVKKKKKKKKQQQQQQHLFLKKCFIFTLGLTLVCVYFV